MKREREMHLIGGERKNELNKPTVFGIDVRTVSYLRRYCSHVSNFLRFGRADEGWLLSLVCQICQIFDIWHI